MSAPDVSAAVEELRAALEQLEQAADTEEAAADRLAVLKHDAADRYRRSAAARRARAKEAARGLALLAAAPQLLAVVRAAEKLDGVWKHTIETITAAEVNARIVANREAIAALPPEVRAMVEER